MAMVAIVDKDLFLSLLMLKGALHSKRLLTKNTVGSMQRLDCSKVSMLLTKELFCIHFRSVHSKGHLNRYQMSSVMVLMHAENT